MQKRNTLDRFAPVIMLLPALVAILNLRILDEDRAVSEELLYSLD